MRLKRSDVADTFELVMSPLEWKEVYALAKFGQIGLQYDCEAPYVTQVFVYELTDPESLNSNSLLQSAFSSLDSMAEQIRPDGRSGHEVILRGLKEEMRELLILLGTAARAEEQAELLYNAVNDAFPSLFPDLEIPSRDYAQAFDDLLTALHEERSLGINLTAKGNDAPALNGRNLSPEIRAYFAARMKELVRQNSDAYADDTRSLETQIDELIDMVNAESLRRHRSKPTVDSVRSFVSSRPYNPFNDEELRERVQKLGATISPPLTAEQLRKELSADQFSKITNIDPELIKAEGERQRKAYVPSLKRYSRERSLAKDLLNDERITPSLH